MEQWWYHVLKFARGTNVFAATNHGPHHRGTTITTRMRRQQQEARVGGSGERVCALRSSPPPTESVEGKEKPSSVSRRTVEPPKRVYT